LDLAMAARTEGAARKAPTLEPERLLAIATEEYHNSRDLSSEMILGESLREGEDYSVLHADGTTSLPKEKDLSPEIRKEVRQVTQRLMVSLASSGESDANPQQVYEWALQVVLRRHKLDEILEPTGGYGSPGSTSPREPAGGKASLDNIVPASVVLNKSSEVFQQDLEANVRWLLLDATSTIVGKVVSNLGKEWQEKEANASMRAALISEFAPAADVLMEAIISKDFKRWLDTLKMQGQGTQKVKDQFEKLCDDCQGMLSDDINPRVVQNICQTVVGSDDIFSNIVKARAKELTRMGKMKKLGESSSDEEIEDANDAFA